VELVGSPSLAHPLPVMCSQDVRKLWTLLTRSLQEGGERTPMRRGLSEGEKQGGAH
jgi:hypothetical protein